MILSIINGNMTKTAKKKSATAQRNATVQSFSRKELVGKFPEIEHRPAPPAKRRLKAEEIRKLVEDMVLV